MSDPESVLEQIDAVLYMLSTNNIAVCIIGEVALNYYNVPRVVHVSYWK